ncbi:MAG TPA: cupin domain-containing protein [Gaiellaceae bacterium]|nr:cupin domain-containing protein [Gaiellaceae bacterium]
MGYDVVQVADLAGEGPGGAVRFVRRRLRVEAFGINWLELAPGERGREHDERASGQEEVYVVVRGSGTLTVDGQAVELEPGTLVRVDPESTRVPVAGEQGLAFVAVGSPRDRPYEPRGPF